MTDKLTRLKYVAQFGYGDQLLNEESFDDDVKAFGSNGPYARTNIANTKAPVIIIGRKGSYGKVNWSSEPCFASDTTFYVDETKTKHNLRWLYYTLQSLRLDEGSNEAAVPGLNRETAYNQRFPVFNSDYEKSIADYLDQETVRLDALIQAKENMLTLLAEKRQALITQAVTRGLDPTVPLKPSGVEWLGDVPEHWEVERTRWLFQERNDRSETGEEEMLTVSHLTGVTPRSEKDVNMFEAESNEGYKVCYPGDLVINTLWAWMGAMGIAPLHGIVSPAYHVYTPSSRIESAYVDVIVRLPVFASEVTRYSKGVWSSRLRLYPEGFYEVYLPVPPLEEQRQIINHIKNELGKLNTLQTAAERTITLLKERRSALITAAVTGQIDIPVASLAG